MSWGNCSVKMSSPNGDFHDEPEGVAPGRIGGGGLRGPVRGRMLGHVEVDDAPAMVGEHDEDEEDAEPRGGHGEEIDRDQV
jgi:hypothetical protein